MLFDQMSAEYGWTDRQILDLPICRLRSISEAVAYRKKMEMRTDAMLVEWSTKTISTFVAATVPTPKGKKNPLLKSAAEITLGLFGKSEAKKSLPDSSDLKAMSPEDIDAIVNRPSLAEQGAAPTDVKNSSEAFQLQFSRFFGGG